MKRAFVTGGSGFVGGRLLTALRQRGVRTSALARSDRAAEAVRQAGADVVVRGSLQDVEALTQGMEGCERAFHAAAKLGDWGSAAEFERVNVQGTDHVLRAAKEAGVGRVVHFSTEAVLASRRRPIVQADESWVLPEDPVGEYPRTKALAERRVQAAVRDGIDAVIVRPRFIWGRGDTTLLPRLVELVRRGQFAWIEHGHYLTSTCHVDNVVEGSLLAAAHGRPGEIYFLTDGEPVDFRPFVTELLRTQGLEPPDRSVPRWLAWGLASAAETTWQAFRLTGTPPLTRTALRLVGEEVTVLDGKARRVLGYVGTKTRVEALAELGESDGQRAAA